MAFFGAHQTLNQISLAKNQHEQAEAFPPGFRFCPLDSELIVDYLQKKVNNEQIPYNGIHDVCLYEHNPDYLADKYQALGEGKWYFFSPRIRKYRNGKRPNRAANDGYWKATMADKPVEHRGVVVGKRKALVFYLGKPPNSKKTNWLMQEYTVVAPPRIKKDKHDMRLDDWVLCKIYKRGPDRSRRGQDEGDEQIADSVRSTEEEVAQGAKHGDNLVEQNYECNMGSSYNQQPSLISVLPPFPNFSNDSNVTVDPQQQQQLLNFPAYPPLLDFTNYSNFPADPQQQQLLDFPAYFPQQHVVDFSMSKYDIPENFESISTMDNLVDPQLPSLLESMDPCSYYLSFTENPSPSPCSSASPFGDEFPIRNQA